jgi:hypothetical protein
MKWTVSPALATSTGPGTWPVPAVALVENPQTGRTNGAEPGRLSVPVVAQSSQVRMVPTRVQGPAGREEAGAAVPAATNARWRRDGLFDGSTPGRAAPGGRGPGSVTVLFLVGLLGAGEGDGVGEGVLVRAGEAALPTRADVDAWPAVPMACVMGAATARISVTSPATNASLRTTAFLITGNPSHRHTTCRTSSAGSAGGPHE